MNFYRVSNLDIKMVYIANDYSDNDKWMVNLFNAVSFFADVRVNKYKKKYSEEEMRQEAMIGLWTAIKTFDYHKNFDFYRWAQWNISKKIRDYIHKERSFLSAKSNTYIDNAESSLDAHVEEKNIIDYIFYSKKSPLSKRESEVLLSLMGFGETLAEVGDRLSLSAERVRQIKVESIKKIKKFQ